MSDAGKRAADEYATHRLADPIGSVGKWIAVRLDDGSSDHALYTSKLDAVRHQKNNEKYFAFIQIGPWQMNAEDASAFIALQRRIYDADMRMTDPDMFNGGRDVIRRIAREDQSNQSVAMFTGARPPSNIRYGVN